MCRSSNAFPLGATMENSGTIIWRDEAVGTVTNIMSDMWYIEADWGPTYSDTSSAFVKFASELESDKIIKNPYLGIVAWLKYNTVPSNSHYVLILSVDSSKLFMRSISDELASYADKKLPEPWLPTDKFLYYEKELKREVSFFHPLNWKKVHAIAIRIDRDDVLFEVSNGRSKYAVVHLTWRKESSRKFPVTKFYKDWQDLYINRILVDSKEWETDP